MVVRDHLNERSIGNILCRDLYRLAQFTRGSDCIANAQVRTSIACHRNPSPGEWIRCIDDIRRAAAFRLLPSPERPREVSRDRPMMAALRQYRCQFARPKPAIARGRTRARPCKLDRHLDRRLLADYCPTRRHRCGGVSAVCQPLKRRHALRWRITACESPFCSWSRVRWRKASSLAGLISRQRA